MSNVYPPFCSVLFLTIEKAITHFSWWYKNKWHSVPAHAQTSMTTFWKWDWWGSSTNVSFGLPSKLHLSTFPVTHSGLAFKGNTDIPCISQKLPRGGKDKTGLSYELSETGARLTSRDPRHREEVCFLQRILENVMSRSQSAALLAHVPWGPGEVSGFPLERHSAAFHGILSMRFVARTLALECNLLL